MTMSQPRDPRIGDAVTYIRQGVTGYSQHPALVYRVEQNAVGSHPALALTVYDSIYDNWSKKIEIQHRDHWAAGGGDDFDEYWCWPWEAEVGQVYQTPEVTGRPPVSDGAALTDLTASRRGDLRKSDLVSPTSPQITSTVEQPGSNQTDLRTALLEWLTLQERFLRAVAAQMRAVALRDDLARRGAHAGEIIGALEQQTEAATQVMSLSEMLPRVAHRAVGLTHNTPPKKPKRKKAAAKKPKGG